MKKFYISVKQKLVFSLLLATLWVVFSLWIAIPWVNDIASVLGILAAWLIVIGIAIIPGFANVFLLSSLLFDKRPKYSHYKETVLPPVSILVAAFNEQDNIKDTLNSILRQQYPSEVEIVVIDDCSTDATKAVAKQVQQEHEASPDNGLFKIKVVSTPENKKKAGALNYGLQFTSHQHVITIDADTYLFRDAIKNIMLNMVEGPENTAAVAGSVLVRNSRTNFLTKMQEWDYFHGIAVVKRAQSLYQGTLVAQGAFSVYKKDVLVKLGGWPETIGEDIVLTWGIHQSGFRVGYAENAIVFTNVPETYKQFFNQRKRWARGLMEAFRRYPSVIWKWKTNTPFIMLNLTFPYTDLMFLVGFVPGVLAAVFFQYYLIVGLMTLLLLPLALFGNFIMFLKQRKIFEEMGLKVRKNFLGFSLYMLGYQLIMSPACLGGYISEFLNTKKTWGTK